MSAAQNEEDPPPTRWEEIRTTMARTAKRAARAIERGLSVTADLVQVGTFVYLTYGAASSSWPLTF